MRKCKMSNKNTPSCVCAIVLYPLLTIYFLFQCNKFPILELIQSPLLRKTAAFKLYLIIPDAPCPGLGVEGAVQLHINSDCKSSMDHLECMSLCKNQNDV